MLLKSTIGKWSKSAVFTTTLVQVSLCLSWWKEWVLLTRPYGISSYRCAMQYVVYHSTLNLGRWRTGFHLHFKKKLLSLGERYNIYTISCMSCSISEKLWIGFAQALWELFIAQLWYFLAFHGRNILLFVFMLDCDNDLTTVIPNYRHHPTEGFAVYFFFIHVSAIKADTPCLNYNYSLDRNLLLLGFYH